jgi:hypothetical protein
LPDKAVIVQPLDQRRRPGFQHASLRITLHHGVEMPTVALLHEPF